ncbi:MAG: hypothetical protein ACYTBZ_06210 [Planctomycetota bacterium]
MHEKLFLDNEGQAFGPSTSIKGTLAFGHARHVWEKRLPASVPEVSPLPAGLLWCGAAVAGRIGHPKKERNELSIASTSGRRSSRSHHRLTVLMIPNGPPEWKMWFTERLRSC